MNELVFQQNNEAVTSSLLVAEAFDKDHKHVLESIENLAAEISASSFFTKTTYTNRGKEYPMYLMNRDGYALLAMGFQGKKALQFKIQYIEAFNKMEEHIRSSKSVTTPALPQTYAEALRALAEQVEQNEQTSQQLAIADKTISEMTTKIDSMEPKATYAEKVLASPSTVIISAIAQDYGYSAVKFNELLAGFRIQYRLNGQWFLYAKYKGKGYVQSRTIEIKRANGMLDYKLHTEWTQQGRLFLYDFLKEKGIVPLIEK